MLHDSAMAATKRKRKQAKSELTRVAEDAKRDLLLRTLRVQNWNLTATAEALKLTSAAGVIRALRLLAPDEYAAAQRRGDVSPGNRRGED